MLVLRKVSGGAYVVENATIKQVIFGPATYSACVQVIEKDRATDYETDAN